MRPKLELRPLHSQTSVGHHHSHERLRMLQRVVYDMGLLSVTGALNRLSAHHSYNHKVGTGSAGITSAHIQVDIFLVDIQLLDSTCSVGFKCWNS